MTAILRQPRPPWRIVEVGPGTGAITAWILPALQAGDRLDLVEINPRFVEFLQVRFARESLFRQYLEQVYLHPVPIQEFQPEQPADCIISGLPLNNFSAATVREILDHMERLLRPGGWLVYFEYLWIRQLKMPFVGKREKRRLYCIGRWTEKFFQRHQETRQLVWCNLPPAIVHTIQIKPS
jgi:phospholipid N-methyltransferase